MARQNAQGVHVLALAGHDERLVAAILDGVVLPLREGVALGQGGNHGVARQGDPIVGKRRLVAHEAQVNLFAAHPFADLLVDALHDAHLDGGVLLVERLDHAGQPMGGHAGVRADGYLAGGKALYLGAHLQQAVFFLHCGAGHGKDARAFLGGGNAVRSALKHGKAQVAFERADKLAHARRGVVQRFGGPGKASLVHGLDECAVARGVHRSPLSNT